MRRQPAVLALLAGVALAAGCSKPEDPCSNDNLKAVTLSFARAWYLYPELLPAAVDLGAYAGPSDLLDALTAKALAARKDRHWSYVGTVDAELSFYGAGTSVGFGIGVLVRGSQLFVSQVYAGSAADVAGFKRGDEIVAVGEADPLTPSSTLIANGAVGAAFGPATAGLVRLFDVIPVGLVPPSTTTVRRTLAKGTFDLDPVPQWQIFDRAGQGLSKVGYVPLRAFISTADARLRAAFAAFQAAGVTDVIVDLRYNGGGLLTTAELLTNLLGGGLAGDVMFTIANSPQNAAGNFSDPFAPESASLAPNHVAFLVTGASASASELVPNALEPWKTTNLALVGHQTYGKPVGQRGIAMCGLVVHIVSFYLQNAQGDGAYFDGLPAPGFSGCAVAADDDLTHETWDPAELQTAAALQWLSPTPTCPPAPVGPLSFAGPTPAPDGYPEAVQPTEAQRHVRGLF